MTLSFLVIVEDHALPALREFKKWLHPTDRLVLYSGHRDTGVDNLTLLEAQDILRDDHHSWDGATSISETDVDPRKRVSELADGLGVDVVVCAYDDTASLLSRSMLMSTTTYALHHCPNHAVMVIHKLPCEGRCRYMLCVDGSEQGMAAARMLAQMLRAGDFVAVWAAFAPPQKMIAAGRRLLKNQHYEEEYKAAQALAIRHTSDAKGLIEGLRNASSGVGATFRLVSEASDKPHKAALEFANTNGIDIIACGSRGLNAPQRMLFGSFSSYLTRNAVQHTVLVVHPLPQSFH